MSFGVLSELRKGSFFSFFFYFISYILYGVGLPGVLSVRPDMHFQSLEKDYSLSNFSLGDVSKSSGGTSEFLAEGSSKYWLVRMGKPPVEVVTKAQAVDYYAQTLTKVLGK